MRWRVRAEVRVRRRGIGGVYEKEGQDPWRGDTKLSSDGVDPQWLLRHAEDGDVGESNQKRADSTASKETLPYFNHNSYLRTISAMFNFYIVMIFQ